MADLLLSPKRGEGSRGYIKGRGGIKNFIFVDLLLSLSNVNVNK